MNEVFPRSQKHIFSLKSAFKIPQMLLVLAKEIFEWCLVAEDIIVLAQKIILYIISGFRKYICGTGF